MRGRSGARGASRRRSWTASTRRASALIRASSSRSVLSRRDSRRLGASAAARLASGAFIDRLELFGDRVERRPFLDAIGLAALDPARDRFERARRARFLAFGAAFKPGDGRLEQVLGATGLVLTRRPGSLRSAARLDARGRGRTFVEFFGAARQSRNSLADRVELVVALEIVGLDALFGGFVGDHVVEPIAQVHAGASRGFFGEGAGLTPMPLTFQAAAPFMVATVAEVVSIEAPSANECAASNVSALVVKKPLRPAKWAVGAVAEGGSGASLRMQLIVAFLQQMDHIRRGLRSGAGGWSRRP